MSEWRFDLDDDQEEDGDEQGEGTWTFGGRAASIFLIDASKEMCETSGDNGEDEESSFKKAVRCAHATMMRKIISSDQDLSAVVLYNTKESKNNIDVPGIYILQELERPGAEKVLQLEELMGMSDSKFEKEYGHSNNANIHETLWVCQSIFNKCKSKLSGQSIMLFTCQDDPHSGNDQKQKQARQKGKDLNEAGISLELLHMGTSFDVNKFYKDLIIPDDSEDEETQEKETLADPASRFEELMDRVKRLEHKQRTTGRVTFTLGPGVEMALGVYTTVRKMNKPYKVKLWKNTNEEVRYMKKEYLEETGELLMPSDYVKYQVYGGKKIKFSLDELRSMNQVYEQGIELLGFKSIESIKPYYHIKPANFLYPDEKSVQGSNKVFAALLDRCLARNVAPIVRMVARRGSSVSWAALIPQKEELDEKNCQITPPGFYACHLPFADDFRNIEIEDVTRASVDQVDAAKDMVKKLHFKYSPENFDNPDIQTHWRNIEALALNRSDLEELVDYTVPDYERMRKKAGSLIESFREMVYPPSYDPNAAPKKRPAASGGSSAPKRAKPDPASVDVEQMAKAGKADKLTVDVLKNWLQDRGIKVTGKKKAQLVQDVMDEVGA